MTAELHFLADRIGRSTAASRSLPKDAEPAATFDDQDSRREVVKLVASLSDFIREIGRLAIEVDNVARLAPQLTVVSPCRRKLYELTAQLKTDLRTLQQLRT